LTLTKPDPGDPFGSGATTSTTVVGAIVDYINEAPINVMETAYGAVGDGTTDDKAAINSAINVANAAGGGRVYLPRLHGVKGQVVLKSNVELIGKGPVGSGLKAVTTWSGASVINCGAGASFTSVKDMTIDANSLVARAYVMGPGGSAAGHNVITRCSVKNATTIGIDVNDAVSGSESHVRFNDITACPTAIRSGQDNQIIGNNMGSFSAYGIDLSGGGCYVAGNHPVANQAGAVCLRMTGGNIHQILGNYLDHGGITLDAPMILVAPGAGNTIRGAIIKGNTFLAPTITVDNTYPAIQLDMTTGTLDGTVIKNNTAIGQNTTHRFSAVVDGVGSPTNTIFDPGFSYFVAEPYTGFTPSLIQTGLVYDGVIVKPVAPRTRYIDVAVSGAGTYTVDSQYGPEYLLTVTTGGAFTVGNPTNKVTGRTLTYRILNSFGTMGTVTWDTNFNLGAAWTSPANGFSRSITFWCDGTKWREHSRTSQDA
jgi:hypothetical protein